MNGVLSGSVKNDWDFSKLLGRGRELWGTETLLGRKDVVGHGGFM